jgi:hypothetical protein
MQKKNLVPLAIILVLIIGAIGYSLIKGTRDQKNDSVSKSSPDPFEDGWKTYSSPMGISFRYPGRIKNKYSGCDDKEGYVPVNIFEDAEKNAVYIAFGCADTLDSLRASTENAAMADGTPIINAKPAYGWKIRIVNIQTENEIDPFLRSTYGEGCYMGGKEDWVQDGVSSVVIKGEDWGREGIDLSNTTCSWNELYQVLYSPASHKLLSINLGQEATFCNTDPQSSEEPICVDGEIMNSLRIQ